MIFDWKTFESFSGSASDAGLQSKHIEYNNIQQQKLICMYHTQQQ